MPKVGDVVAAVASRRKKKKKKRKPFAGAMRIGSALGVAKEQSNRALKPSAKAGLTTPLMRSTMRKLHGAQSTDAEMTRLRKQFLSGKQSTEAEKKKKLRATLAKKKAKKLSGAQTSDKERRRLRRKFKR